MGAPIVGASARGLAAALILRFAGVEPAVCKEAPAPNGLQALDRLAPVEAVQFPNARGRLPVRYPARGWARRFRIPRSRVARADLCRRGS